MKKLVLLCACVLLSMAVMTSARPPDDSTDKLEELLVRLLSEKKGMDKKHVCDDKNCNTGRCGGGENPHGWDEAYYCFDCNGKDNTATNGGLHCELPDPCGQNSGSNPCKDRGTKTECKTTSMKPEGYRCRRPKKTRSSVDDLLDHLENDADQPEYHEIRMMMARSQSAEEGLANYVRSMLE